MTDTNLATFLVVFALTAVIFIALNLAVGRLVRPDRPDPQKSDVYECGEEAEGDARGQFDLRFYVVALLFVVFDVEVAFLFPWAVVFGRSVQLADATRPPEAQVQALTELSGRASTTLPAGLAQSADALSWLALADAAAFFGVLLVGFAYLWRRGDLDWVRSVAGQRPGAAAAD